MAKKKKQPTQKTGKPGRPRRKDGKWLNIEEITPLLRARGINSVSQYHKWHRENDVHWCPRYPERVWREDFPSWREYLGVMNPSNFEDNRQKPGDFWSYVEARRYLHRLQFTKIADYKEWRDELEEKGEWPTYLPRNPERSYTYRNEWISWRDYLGVDITRKINAVKEAADNKVWVLLQHPNEIENIFWWRTVSSQDLKNIESKGFIVKKQYVFEEELKDFVENILAQYAYTHEDDRKGHYVTNAMPSILFELNTALLQAQ